LKPFAFFIVLSKEMGVLWMKKLFSIVVMAVLLLATGFTSVTKAADGKSNKAIDEKLGVPIVVYGANLSDTEKEMVKTALRVNEEPEVEEITVSGQDLAKYISNGNSSARMYSSAKITRQEEGKGLVISIVTQENITQVTSEIYANAMLTAGIEDAVVEIAAPKPVTGHSALVGIYKAYEVSTGETLDTERTDVANEELSVATSIAESAGIPDEKVAELLTEIKKQIAEKDPASREDVEQIVSDQLSKLDITLSDKDRQLLVDLMDQIRNLNINFDEWKGQLSDITNTLEEKFGDLMDNEGFWESVKNFFKNLADTISSWFGGSSDEQTE
jgi:uncharacterized protein YpuA (DUF1002 family)